MSRANVKIWNMIKIILGIRTPYIYITGAGHVVLVRLTSSITLYCLEAIKLSSNILTSLLRPSQKHSFVFSGFWVWSSGSKSCRSKWNRRRGMQEIIVVSWWLFSQYNINGMILLKCIYNTVHKITKCQFNKFNDLEVTQHHPLEQGMHSHNCSIKYRCHLNHPKDLQWTIFA